MLGSRIAIYDSRNAQSRAAESIGEALSAKVRGRRTNDLAWNAVSPFIAAIMEDNDRDIDIASEVNVWRKVSLFGVKLQAGCERWGDL